MCGRKEWFNFLSVTYRGVYRFSGGIALSNLWQQPRSSIFLAHHTSIIGKGK